MEREWVRPVVPATDPSERTGGPVDGLGRPEDPPGELLDPPVTGDPVVDEVVAAVAAAALLTPEAQLPCYDEAHRALADRLADVDG